ncbi:MAG: Succinate dehydrogenase cytochrome b558 subunit [uncultured Phycisphaerae bacterium]|uniref:Succinate dehydrogenase cytochrome b558 subunit n=1 Tax=uncultured Phycisphaerae bacterium TaxID=904963 RepID=A0A6J4NB83_9BACT|nr:MAG: Succinate dehydrogenase cytochrome b558 subunit [uncultured Phycisphaerae bacterium]
MSTANALDYANPAAAAERGFAARHHFLLRRLHSLTGLVFGGYLVVHLLVNATIAQGGTVYQTQVDKIHSLPFLPVIEWTFIYLPILFHTVYGVWITLTGQPNVNRYAYGKNWAYVLQRVSAILIVLFMLFHVLALKYGLFGQGLRFEPGRALGTVGRHFDSVLLVAVVYPIGILASCYHLANGFWTAGITWGLTVSANAQRRWGYACAGLFAITFVAGMIALVWAARLDWSDLLRTQQELGHGA